jgi:uncharacterized membrane protein
MATIPAPRADAGEARFFFVMACIMAATNVAGFAANLAMGRSSFAMPPVVHFHAVMMLSWMALYVIQTALVAGNNLHLHRKLGKAALVVLAMVALSAVLVTINSMRTAGGPPFFDQNQFLFSNLLQLTGVVGMVCWAIALRANTGWHRRLMMCAFAMLTGPGIGRLLPMPLFIPYAWWIASIAVPLIWPLIGVLADKRRYGTVHPAWLAGMGTFLIIQIIADLLAYSAWGVGLTQTLIEGTPGAERGMAAFFPPM